MKNFLFLGCFLFAALTASAQSGSAFFKSFSDTNDTLGVNTTKTYNLNTGMFGGQNITDTWSYSITIEADSLSGAAADSSTVFVQVSNSPTSDPNPLWVTVETDEINGTSTQVFHYTGDVYEPRIQIILRSKSGAKAIATRTYATLKRKYKTR